MNESAPDEVEGISRLVAQADAAYTPFPSFASWSHVRVDAALWNSHRDALLELSGENAARLESARRVAQRAAAIDTGALEGLYDLDKGRTITIAIQTTLWEHAYAQESERTRALIECQLGAYDFVMDFATRAVPIAEAWIRELHKRICAAQATYPAWTAVGVQDQPLRHGEYKGHPNHVKLGDGSLFAYAPVHETAVEMKRLIEELRTDAFKAAHPAVQAAYAHYAFVRIHPFQDGNGRVARALASVFTYRSDSIPVLVLVAHKAAYLAALQAADKTDHQAFVDFIYHRGCDAFLLVAESMRAAAAPDPRAQVDAIRSRNITRGGYTHHQVDLAGQTLLRAVSDEVKRQSVQHTIPNEIAFRFEVHAASTYQSVLDGYRGPIGVQAETTRMVISAAGPGSGEVNRHIFFNVPRDCGVDDSIVVRCVERPTQVLQTPISRILGSQQGAMDFQVTMWVEGLLGDALADLNERAEKRFREQGY